MSIKFQIKVRGLKKLDRKLKRLTESMAGTVLEKAGLKAAVPIMKAMEARIQSPGKGGTGEMRRDLTIAVRRPRKKNTRVAISIGPGDDTGFRAHFLEFGTRHAPAFPFMRPAIPAAANESLRVFKREIKTELKRVARRSA